MTILQIVLTNLAVLSTLAALLMLGYLRTTERKAPRFADSIRTLETRNYTRALLSVIVTAKNEEQTIHRCLDSLLRQSYRNLEIEVVDDSSADRTPQIVKAYESRDQRVRLVNAGPKPRNWVGKTWPCWRGYEESRGELLLFLDADSVLEPEAIELAVKYLTLRDYDMFSIAPRVKLQGIWSYSVMPIISGAINLLYPMIKVNDPANERAYVFGTFILMRKETYETVGGHKGVKNKIVEDAALASAAKSSGAKLRIENAPEIAWTEWESDLGSIYSGLERIISTSVRSYGLVSILNAVLMFFVMLYPLIFVVGSLIFWQNTQSSPVLQLGFVASFIGVLALLLLTYFELELVTGRAGAAIALYPLGGVLFVSAIITTSLKVSSGKGIKWKGESYAQIVERKI